LQARANIITLANHPSHKRQIFHFIHHPKNLLPPPNFPQPTPPKAITYFTYNHLHLALFNLQPPTFIPPLHSPFQKPHQLIQQPPHPHQPIQKPLHIHYHFILLHLI
uniref:YmdB family metallophosphoesterase n=1 Tax=Priestia megaterium TaxID=1404 RepID=UPI001649E7CC